jgi:hypothetical protein
MTNDGTVNLAQVDREGVMRPLQGDEHEAKTAGRME